MAPKREKAEKAMQLKLFLGDWVHLVDFIAVYLFIRLLIGEIK